MALQPQADAELQLRWDYIAPFKEKFNNLSFIDPNGLNPGAVTAPDTTSRPPRLCREQMGSGQLRSDYP